MASDKRWVLSRIPHGRGNVLDLGGGTGALRQGVEARGYRYVNVDLAPSGDGLRVVGDAHALPFRRDSFAVVASSDSLEHFWDTRAILAEVRRVLRPGGKFVIWVPFMHPFHGTDYFRFTPLALRKMLRDAGFSAVAFESPLWIASVGAQVIVAALQRVGYGALERTVERIGAWIDLKLRRFRPSDASFASFFLVTAEATTTAECSER